MTKVDVVLALICSEPGLTDQQIRTRLNMKYLAHVNQLCHSLVAHGLIQRIQGPHGKLVNVPVGVEALPPLTGRTTVGPFLPGGASTAAGESAIAELWQPLGRLDLARTLLVIPCSAAKRLRGAVKAGPQLANMLPRDLAQQLTRAQAAAAPKAKLDSATLLPAWRRYQGAFYKAAGPALETAIKDQAHILILSGGYGVLLARQPIGVYNAVLHPGWWPDHVLQHCLVAYAVQHSLSAVVAFAGGHTPYAQVVRSAAWGANGIDQAFLLSPETKGKGGAMGVVPGALGEAFAAVWSRTMAAGWTSTTGLRITIELLS